MPIDFGPLITSADCAQCRKCCTFTEDELTEAPIFSDEQRKLATGLSDEPLVFDRRGAFWQLRLKKADRTDRWICPLFETESGACKAQANKPLNCSIYPAHAVAHADTVMLAITNVCPVVNDKGQLRAGVDQYTRDRLGQAMQSAVERNPELVIPFRDDAMTVIEPLQP